MDFHEPDLEDLIQSDLNTEMNKILDQSESGDCCTNIQIGNNSPSMPTNKSLLKDSCEKVRVLLDKPPVSQCISEKHDSANLSQSMSYIKQELTTEDVSLMFETSSSKSNNLFEKSDLHQSTFSGHFSLEKLPTTEESVKLENYQVGIGENNDLSSLTWLTGVDVQQTLQVSSSVDDAISSNSVEEDLIQSQCMQGSSHTISPGTQLECGSVKSPLDTSVSPNQISKKQPMRFTPIQPNISYDERQRYQLHQGSEPIHSRMLSNEQRIGMHRSYHPYPPPPYGSAASYIPTSYRHSRLHNQSKKVFPKPVYSYSCLIAMSLRASKTGCLPVSDIYNFMMENFPYFKTAPDGWKNSVRHNLSLNKCFEKVEKPNGSQRKGCLWALNPAKITKMEEEVQKWKRKDPEAIRRSMSNPAKYDAVFCFKAYVFAEELDRELEEIRRADEEAARRRMLSMTSHGLSMLTPPPQSFNPYARPTHQSNQIPNLHPSGTASLPTTPQHYHHHHHQQNPSRGPLPPAHGHALPGLVEDLPHPSHQPRQLFNYPLDQPNYSYAPCPPSSSRNVVVMQQNDVGHPSLFAPSYSDSPSSSGNTSLLGTLADTISKSTGDLNEIDLDSSLADLSAFQGALWDESEGELMTHPLVSEVESFDDVISRRSIHPSISSSSINTVERCSTDDKALPDASIFGASSHFAGDMYMNGSGKAVILQ